MGHLQKILIVDDKAENLFALGQILSQTGAELVEASNGNDALIASLNHEFAVAILDVQMPEMSGYELAEYLRKDKKTSHLPLIFLSAVFSDEYHIFKGYEAGAVDFIAKPFDPRILIGKVNVFMELDRQRSLLRDARDELELRVQERTAELQVAYSALEQHSAQLKAMNQELQEFAFIASHDLQEPLRKVTAFGDMLKQKFGASLGEQGRDYLERIHNANQRMQSLLSALLEYSRLATRADAFVKVELTEIIHEVLSDLEIRIQKTGGEVKVGDLPAIHANPTQMRQLFQNLIGNALKFHKEGQKPVISVKKTATCDGCVQIVVEDNGIGFEERYLEKIFAPFHRLHGKSGPYEGTGMGLAICKKIVERHGGSITAKSTPDKGAIFIIDLPVRQAGL